MAVIEINNLVKHFGKVKAVDGISFTVEAGEIFGFLGPNGAGKTTTIRCLMDFIRPTTGTAHINGLDAQAYSTELKNQIGYLSPDVRLYNHWTGEQHIQYIAKLRSDSKKALKTAHELCKLFDFNPKLRTRSLSSGNKQKLGLILAFMHNVQLLILDEPTAALDPILQNSVYSILEEKRLQGTTIFLSSHNLAEVERICHRVAIIRKGKLAAVENIEALKQKKLHIITARFHTGIEPGEFRLPGTESLTYDKLTLTVKMRGDLTPLIKMLAKYTLADLDISHATLEEAFLEYYS